MLNDSRNNRLLWLGIGYLTKILPSMYQHSCSTEFRGLTADVSSQSDYPNYLFSRTWYVCLCFDTRQYLFSRGLENASQDPARKDVRLTSNVWRLSWGRMPLWGYLLQEGGSRKVHLFLLGGTTPSSAGSPAAGPHSDLQTGRIPSPALNQAPQNRVQDV